MLKRCQAQGLDFNLLLKKFIAPNVTSATLRIRMTSNIFLFVKDAKISVHIPFAVQKIA